MWTGKPLSLPYDVEIMNKKAKKNRRSEKHGKQTGVHEVSALSKVDMAGKIYGKGKF